MKTLKTFALVSGAFFLVACGRPPLEERLADETLFEGISFIGMTVSDPDHSAEVYGAAFGVERHSHDHNDLTALLIAASQPGEKTVLVDSALKTTNTQLLMFRPSGDAEGAALPVNGPGIAHVCFQVGEDLNAYQRFLEAGATVIGDPEMVKLSPINPVRYAYVHDPDGMVIEIEHVNMAIAGLFQEFEVDRRIRHVSLATGDIDRLMKFYQTLLFVEKPRRSPKLVSEKMDRISGLPGSELYMGWMHIGNVELEFVQYLSHPVTTDPKPRPMSVLGYNLIMLDVNDLEKARARFVAAGGKIVSNDLNVAGSRVVLGRDPDQNLIGMGQFGSDSALDSAKFLRTF